jgi:2-polyprenyl-6-methoxyphenol hydroxylase-like FAD-dependent oxidoreductase
LKKWTSDSGRVILIGDAAHGMSPASGQGGAMALEDAETLAYALTHDGAVSTRLVPTWQEHRQKRVREVVAYTAETERRRRPSPNVVLQKIKEWILWGILWYHGEHGMNPWMSKYDGKEQMAALCNE